MQSNLYNLRKEHNYTQKNIANALNVNIDTYSKWEREINDFSLETANKLAVFYNVSLDYLLGLSQTSHKVKNNIDLNILSKRLKKLRKDNNLNQKDLSNIIKLPQTTYSNYERGYRIITTYKLITICKFYNTSMDYLTGKTNIKDLAFS